MNEDLQRQLSKTIKEHEIQKSSISKGVNVVKDLLIEKSTIERKEARSKVMQNRLRLGQFVTQRVGASFQVIIRYLKKVEVRNVRNNPITKLLIISLKSFEGMDMILQQRI